MKVRTISVIVLLTLLSFSSIAWSEQILIGRDLPIANLNNAAGANRSNVSWAEPTATLFDGDSFTLSGSGNYVINSITTWSLPTPNLPLGNTFSAVTLYGGEAGSNLGVLSTGNFSTGANLTDNASILEQTVTYLDTTSYQGQSGTYYPILQTTFSNLNWNVTGGQSYYFGVYAARLTVGGPNDDMWFLHASANGALAGNTQDGWDGNVLIFDVAALGAAPTVFDSANGNGWDKSSDLNYRITGDQVPEPGSMMLFGTGLATIAASIRRRFNK
jgi:hypothetical protein